MKAPEALTSNPSLRRAQRFLEPGEKVVAACGAAPRGTVIVFGLSMFFGTLAGNLLTRDAKGREDWILEFLITACVITAIMGIVWIVNRRKVPTAKAAGFPRPQAMDLAVTDHRLIAFRRKKLLGTISPQQLASAVVLKNRKAFNFRPSVYRICLANGYCADLEAWGMNPGPLVDAINVLATGKPTESSVPHQDV